MKIYLIRHGESKANMKNVLSGQTNVELSDMGVEQSRILSEALDGIEFSTVYSSDLKRAVDTAKLITREAYEIKLAPEIREMNFGIFENKSFQSLKEEKAPDFLEWSSDFVNNVPIGGESMKNMFDRVIGWYDAIIREARENKLDKVMIVAHSGPIRSILANEIGGSTSHYFKFRVDNCRINMIEYNEKGKPSLVFLNSL